MLFPPVKACGFGMDIADDFNASFFDFDDSDSDSQSQHEEDWNNNQTQT